MTRKKIESSERLGRKIGLRVTDKFYHHLLLLLPTTNCRSVAELARAILIKEQIVWLYKDASLDGVVAELSSIKSEVRMIGKNVNQVAKSFSSAPDPSQKITQALILLDEYRKVSDRLEPVMKIIGQLSEKWLQK
ncbi:mobilization protein [Pseudochryseolinea flava]|uniref:Mobilization protein n=1 Tax=Pseudochryseolinea flava TaxID=2059302 RepID=A0A364Y437_9BACT|nr:mobilization protein [Pseudochryseolinea flava]RAW01526.1 mobilization protein [Pseudochryseolinea flava]